MGSCGIMTVGNLGIMAIGILGIMAIGSLDIMAIGSLGIMAIGSLGIMAIGIGIHSRESMDMASIHSRCINEDMASIHGRFIYTMALSIVDDRSVNTSVTLIMNIRGKPRRKLLLKGDGQFVMHIGIIFLLDLIKLIIKGVIPFWKVFNMI